MQSYIAPSAGTRDPLEALKSSGRKLGKKVERRETKILSHIKMFEQMSHKEDLDSSFGADDYGDYEG
jgi:hypothetical protein